MCLYCKSQNGYFFVSAADGGWRPAIGQQPEQLVGDGAEVDDVAHARLAQRVASQQNGNPVDGFKVWILIDNCINARWQPFYLAH